MQTEPNTEQQAENTERVYELLSIADDYLARCDEILAIVKGLEEMLEELKAFYLSS